MINGRFVLLMIPEKKNKILIFITGASLGLLFGGAFVYFTRNTNIVKYPLEVSQNTIRSIVNEVMETLSLKKDSTQTAEVKPNYKYKKNSEKETSDSLASVNDSIVKSEKLGNDSLMSSASDTIIKIPEEQIQIKKETLEEIRVVEVVNMSADLSNNNKDSLLSKVSGVQIDKVNKKNNFSVEFWQSPINYKGYKLGKNKLIVYGIAPDDFYKVIQVDNSYYMRYGNSCVKLVMNSNFNSFEKITTPEIISLLN